MIRAYAANGPKQPLKPFEYEPGPLGATQVEIAVEYCGICHSDMSVLNNEWGISTYPVVPGHEVVGRVVAAGAGVKSLNIGQRVGLGWYASSCMTCEWCVGGEHNLCLKAQGVIVGRHGGFADKVRADQTWVIPIPHSLDAASAGPLMCGGITVFNPLVQFNVKPTDRVGVIGIGGLGHMALQFTSKWGCDVTAFSTSPDKEAEARSFGATHFVNPRDTAALKRLAGSFDMILSTIASDLDWSVYIDALRPKGRLHFVGVAPSPVSTHVFPLIVSQRSISGSPLGSPRTTALMLDFAARHKIKPLTESFPMSQVNDALTRLESGKARYRVVLAN